MSDPNPGDVELEVVASSPGWGIQTSSPEKKGSSGSRKKSSRSSSRDKRKRNIVEESETVNSLLDESDSELDYQQLYDDAARASALKNQNQKRRHSSIVNAIEADPTNPNIVYVFGEAVDLGEISEEQIKQRKLDAMTRRDKVYVTYNDPTYSTIASIYTAVNFLAIFISTINFLIGSLPEYICTDCEPPALFYMEAVIIGFFTQDYIVRLILTRKNRARWMFRDFFNLVDLFAIAPFYIELSLRGQKSIGVLVVLRVLRLFRVFRILKVSKYSKQIPIAVNAVTSSGTGFMMAAFTMTLFVTLFGAAVFFGEGVQSYFDPVDRAWKYYADDSLSPFQSIPHTLWWCLVTMTTVGYGDQAPVTAIGKIIGSVTMISGVLVLAFPLTILSNNFGEEYNKATLEEEESKRTRLYRSLARGEDNFHDHESLILVQELYEYMLALKSDLDAAAGAYVRFQRNYEQVELRLGKLRIIQGLAKMERLDEEEFFPSESQGVAASHMSSLAPEESETVSSTSSHEKVAAKAKQQSRSSSNKKKESKGSGSTSSS